MACDYWSSMRIINNTSSVVIVEIDFNEKIPDFGKKVTRRFADQGFSSENIHLIDSTDLLYRITLKTKEELEIAANFNSHPPKIDHLQKIRIIEPYESELEGEEEIRSAFKENAKWSYELRLD